MGEERKKILIEASGCHVHLTQAAVEALFGKGSVLKKRRDLSQPGEFLSEQRVKLVTKDGSIENVAVLGPTRSAVQVELSKTDCRKLGLQAPVSLSGHLEGASDVMIIGDQGEIKANGSVIVARNHIHMRPEDAIEYGVSDGQLVRVEVESDRKVIFEDVPIRVSPKFAPAMHIDFDEANACSYRVGTEAFILYDTPEENRGLQSMDLEKLICEVVESVCKILQEEKCSKGQLDQPVCVAEEHSTETESACETAPCDAVYNEKLVTEKMAKEYCERCHGSRICFAKGVIITPAAKDIFKAEHKNIEIL